MRGYTSDELSEALLAAGFSDVTPDHHGTNPWITLLARKGREDMNDEAGL